MARKLKQLFLAGACIFILILGFFWFQTHDSPKRLVIGAKNCTEQQILVELLAQLIEAKAPEIRVERRFHLEGTNLCFSALRSGQIDLYFEYTGTALLDILKAHYHKEMDIYNYVKKEFREKYGLEWLDRLGFSNNYVLVMRSGNLSTFSELPDEAAHLRVGFDPEFAARPELKRLMSVYQFKEPFKAMLMDQVLLYLALMKGGVDLISGFATDGRLLDPSFEVLKDDLSAFPTYEIAPLMLNKKLNQHPKLLTILGELKGRITESDMRELNHKVEIEGETVEDVVKEFIINRKLI